jgi:hypothetical protein
MRIAIWAIALGLAACSGHPAGVKPQESPGSRRDGIVTMASTGTLYNPVGPDWRLAQAAADRRCRSWGYAGAGSFSGWQESCEVYDFHGRCARTTVTRFYPCLG